MYNIPEEKRQMRDEFRKELNGAVLEIYQMVVGYLQITLKKKSIY